MLKKIKTVLSNSYVQWVFVITFFVIIGFALNLLTYKEGIDLGDGSTFYSFAKNIYHGEDVYQDFIHFRTPGSYFLHAIMLNLMGDQITSVKFSGGLEGYVLYILIFMLAVGIFLKFKKPLIGFLTGSLIIFLPAFGQLRTALAFLTVALYIQSQRSEKKIIWLILTGCSLAATFFFGQEMAVAAIITIGLAELISIDNIKKATIISVLKKWGIIAASALVTLLPFITYLLVKSSLGTFLYYTFYYGFILQPKGMDIDFPPFAFMNLLYYLPLVGYFIGFFIVFMLQKKNWFFAILLGFTIARAVTLVGRTDYGHLIFVLPELFFVLVLCAFSVSKLSINRKNLLAFILYAAVFVVGLVMMTISSSMFVIIPIATVLLAIKLRPDRYPAINTNIMARNFIPAMVVGAFLVLFVYILYDGYKSTIKTALARVDTGAQVEGANVSIATKQQYLEIKAAVDEFKPETIFSYPIQAFYYTLAPKHAARFMTFEPQTTVTEQQQTIDDLKRTKPGVIIFDPEQAEALYASTGRITDYIKSNYKVYKVVNVTRELWVMIPNSAR